MRLVPWRGAVRAASASLGVIKRSPCDLAGRGKRKDKNKDKDKDKCKAP
jgi:hypothetical protein